MEEGNCRNLMKDLIAVEEEEGNYHSWVQDWTAVVVVEKVGEDSFHN